MELRKLCELAHDDRINVGSLTTEIKNKVLLDAAFELENHYESILDENEKDILNAKENHMSVALIDRLTLTKDRVFAMADGLRQIANLVDPIGEIITKTSRPNGLIILKKRVPIGVVGIIYEARPNVTSDAFGLCFKTGNCSILKGGSDAINSNIAIVKLLKKALSDNKIPDGALSLIESTDRATTNEFMKMDEFVDVLIPRGGTGLIQNVVKNATIPVIETGTGNCHVFVDESADFEMALNIIENAKTQRIGVCNACESILVHKKIARDFLPLLYDRLVSYNVEMRGDDSAVEILGTNRDLVVKATEKDWGKEYLDYILSVKLVDSVEEAILHINKYNTAHSETIVTQDNSSQELFFEKVDAACVYANASTRFSDGNEFGFGAEIGISTQKLHARGPMGLEALTSYKYTIYGTGQVRK